MSSLTEVSHFPLAESAPPAFHADAPENRRQTNLLALAWRSRWLILLTMLIGGGAGWAVLQRTEPRFTSLSRIYIERSLPRILDDQIMMAPSSTSYLFTQAELIRSASVLAAAADATENAGLESFRNVENRVAFLKTVINVNVGANDEIINIWTELPKAEDAAQIVNSVVDAYITKYAENRKSSAAEVLAILKGEKQRRDDELIRARKDLEEFRKLYPSLGVQVAADNVVIRKYALLSDELMHAEIELLKANSRLSQIENMYKLEKQRPLLLEMAAKELATSRDMELERQVKDLERSISSQRAQWGEGHPSVKVLVDSLVEVKKELRQRQAAIIEGYVESFKVEYESLRRKSAELKQAADEQYIEATKISGQVTTLASLQEAVIRAERECDTVDGRIKEVNLTEEVGAMQVSVLETAGPAGAPSYPVPSRFLGMGFILGGLAGFGLAWLRDMLDHRLRSVDEIAEALQLPVLGVLPHLGGPTEAAHIGRLVAHAPRCSIAEAVRTLRTSLHFGLAGHDAQSIAVTSPSPGDGKSTLASNLAIAMAQAGLRVLIIDADLRRPSLHHIFEAPNELGLSTILAGRRPAHEAIIKSGIDSLDLLPSGPVPTNPVELLNNGYFAELLDELKRRYDKIIIDSPPVMPVADARVIAAISDSTLLVLRAERSTRRLSIGARNELWRVRARRLGVAVNGVPTRRQGSYGYGYGYGYGADDYSYGPYGVDDSERLSSSRRKKGRALPSPQPAAAGEEI